MTRCATKLIDKRNLQINKKFFIPDMSKKFKIKPGKELILNEDGFRLADQIALDILDFINESKDKKPIEQREIGEIDYFKAVVDKFHFHVPKMGYYFNENDCWIKPEGNRALMGISDFLQKQAGDIIMVELPEMGLEVEQFDDFGNFESTKTVLQLISPGSGKICAINKELENAPELVNQDCYGKGWFVEIELKDFDADKELLMDGPAYFPYMQKKIEQERLKREKKGV
jgi:glycine cleavage system H protein